MIAALDRQSRNHPIVNPQWIVNFKFQIINA